MSGGWFALLAIAGAGAVLLHERRSRRRRWEHLRGSGRSGLGRSGPARSRAVTRRLDPAPIGALAVAVLILTVLPWPWAIPIAGGGALGALVAVPRLDRAAARERHGRLVDGLPLVLDLLAAACASGAPPARAMAAVGEAIEGPWGEDLARVEARVRLGAPWSEAFTGSALTELAPVVVRTWIDAEAWGAAPATALAQAADSAREARRRRGEAAARSVAVAVVGPLGLCFLPAFVLLGIVPAVLGALGPALT